MLEPRSCFQWAVSIFYLCSETVNRYLPHATFSHAQSLQNTDDMRSMTQDSCLSCVSIISHSSTRHVSSAPHATLNTSTSSLPPTSLVLLSFSEPRLVVYATTFPLKIWRDGTSTVLHFPTGSEPRTIEINRILVNPQNRIINDRDYIEEIGLKPLSYSQSLIQLSLRFGRKALHTNSDLEDEQIRKMLASPLYSRERDEYEEQARACHSE